MLSKNEFSYYNRQIILKEIGEDGQLRIRNASVLIVGVGGLGCPIAQYLVAAGVGQLTLIDHDLVDVSNLHRQVLFNFEDIGKNKASVAKEKLRKLNPYIDITAIEQQLNKENCLRIIAAHDLIIDGSDNFYTKYLINDACVILNKPWVFGSIYKFQGQVSVFNYLGGPTYRCLFPDSSELKSCSIAGVIGVLPGIIGGIMANEAIKVITGLGVPLSGKLMVFDVLQFRFNVHNIRLIEKNKQIENILADQECRSFHAINIDQIKSSDMLIDVRTDHEHKDGNIGGINISLDKIETSIEEIRNNQKENQRIVLYCKSGTRSNKAVSILLKHNIHNVFSLKEGIGITIIFYILNILFL